MRKTLVLLGLSIVPFLYFNCAKDSGGTDQSGAQVSSASVRETLTCTRNDIGLIYTMVTYSDSSKAVTCTRFGSIPITKVSSIECPKDSPMTVNYTYPVTTYRMIGGQNVPVETHQQVVTFSVSYTDPNCSLVKL